MSTSTLHDTPSRLAPVRTRAVAALAFAAMGCGGGSSPAPDTSAGASDASYVDAADSGALDAALGDALDASDARGDAEADAPSDAAVQPRHLTDLADGSWIESLAWSPDGVTLWAAAEAQIGGATGETRGVRVSTGATVATASGPVWSVGVSPDGAHVLSGGAVDAILGAADGRVERTIAGAAGAGAWSHDGARVAVVAGDVVRILRALDGVEIAHVDHPIAQHERVWRVAFSPDDALLVTSSGQNGLGSPHGTTYVWRTTDWTGVANLPCTTFDAAFSPDGARLALACWLSVQVVDTNDWTSARDVPLTGGALATSVAYSPDGARLAVGTFGGGVQLVRTTGSVVEATLADGASSPTIKALAWSPDGRTLAGAGWDDATVRLWAIP